MQLTDEDIQELQAAWEADFGEVISPAEARKQGFVLLELYAVLYGPDPEDARARMERGGNA